MTEAEKKALYDKLVASGTGSAAASAASGYTPPAPAPKPEPAKPAVSPFATADRAAEGRARVAAITAPAPGTVSPRAAAMGAAPAPKPDAVSGAAPTAAPKEETPAGGSFAEHYEAQGEAYDRDLRGFATYMRGLADKGELVDASGKPLPMYSADKLAAMSTSELQAFMEANPRYANMYFPKPSAETTAALAGTGRTGVGESGFVRVPEIGGGAAKPAASGAAAAKEESAVPEDPHSEATMVGAGGGASEAKKPSFGQMLGELAKKYGGNILEVIQAGAYGQAGIDAPLAIDKRVAEEQRIAAEERAKTLAEDDKTWQEKLVKDERAYQTTAAEAAAKRQAEYARLVASLQPTGAEAPLPDDVFDPSVESLETYLGRAPGGK